MRSVCWAASVLASCVLACDDQPLAPSLDASAAGTSGLKPPSATNAMPTTSTTIAVAWTDNSSGEIGFRIERSVMPGGPWATAGTTGAGVTTFSDGGRTSEQQVCYRVVAFKRNGESGPSNIDCSTPPAGPTNLTAQVIDHQTVELTWVDHSAVETGYEVERASAAGGPFSGLASTPANATSYSNNGLTINTTYWYRVRPSADGGHGDYSNVAGATPVSMPPSAASGVTAIPHVAYIVVTWVDNSTTEDGFRIERSADGGATWSTALTMSRDATTAGVGVVQTEQQVCYRVIAYSTEGDAPPSNVACTALPEPPTVLTATTLDGQSLTLTWRDNSAVEDGYEVQRQGPTDGSMVVLAELPANTTSYRDAAVSIDVRYRYQVVAKKDGGTSYPSNVESGMIATSPPAAPSGLDVFPESSTGVTGYWTDATNEDGLRVERSSDGGASWVMAATIGPGERFDDFGRLSEQQVCYRVIAYNSAGDSPPSNTDCTTPPAAPSSLVATSGGMMGEVNILTWSDNSGVEDGYAVLRLFTYCDDGCYSYYEAIAILDPNTTTYGDSNIIPGNTYTYVVVAIKDGGYSDQSNDATVYGQ